MLVTILLIRQMYSLLFKININALYKAYLWRSEMTKRVAWFTCEPKHPETLTPNKVYDVFNEANNSFNLKDDTGDTRFCWKKCCDHIRQGDWVFADVVEKEVKPVETVKRKGVVALLPEDSKFEIGQRVRVDRSGYAGYTTIIGYSYDYNEYATECDENNSCFHDCDGLSKKRGFGLWVEEGDIVKPVEAEQPAAVTKKPKKWGSWIKNKTGECPVGLKRKQKVKLKWSDGDEFVIGNPQDAAWYFSEGENPIDITHYKILLKDADSSLPPKSKWTKNTGVMPVDGDVKVEFKRRDGCKFVMVAHECYWRLDGDDLDIIKWRLAK